MPMWRALRQMPAQAGRLEEGRGEAESYSGSDEARRPRHRSESTGSSRHLNLLNRPVRTRMPGGVGGEGPQGSPYPDFSPNALVLPDLQRRVVKLGWCFWDDFK